MKRVIKSDVNLTDDEFIPDAFTADFIDEYVIPKIESNIYSIYGKRFKNMQIDFDDAKVGINGNRLSVDVMIYNGNQLKKNDTFEFTAYADYWDEGDFHQHLNRSIHDFVASM